MKKIKIISLCLVIIILLGVLSFGPINVNAQTDSMGVANLYPEFDDRIERDYMYSVAVTDRNGTKSLPVYNHTSVSAVMRNPLDVTADQYRRFSTFEFDSTLGGVRVDIKVNCDFNSYSIIPSAKNFRNEFSNGVISVYLDNPDYFMIRLDDKDSTLIAVFADVPETDIPKDGNKTLIVDSWYEESDGILEITEENTTIYVKPGAVLKARIYVKADNCKIIGRGAIVDPYSDYYNYDQSNIDQHGLIWVYDASGTVIDGVHILNSVTYSVFVQGHFGYTYSENTSVTNIKILSTLITSDGISFNYYNKGSYAEHCFVYCGDNALVYEDEAHYKDILVGTTCNAIYPQTDVINSSCEDIYVFRADEGIINTAYSGSNYSTIVDNSTITNLYALDVTYTPYFLYVENPDTYPAVSRNGGMTIKNVYLPKLDSLGDRFYYNVTAGDYEINLINLSLDGQLVSKITTYSSASNKYKGYVTGGFISNWGEISYPKGHTFTYSTTSDFKANITAHKNTVNYKNDINFFIGKYQVFFENQIKNINGNIYIPYREIKEHLGVGACENTIYIEGVEYILHTDLATAKMADSVSISSNNLNITPFNVGEDILVKDGNISKLTEFGAQYQALCIEEAENGSVYTVKDTSGKSVEGIYREITQEVKKYGAGTYTLSFEVKSTSSSSKNLNCGINYGAELDSNINGKIANIDTVLSDTWKNVTLSFNITNNHLGQTSLSLMIYDCDNNIDDFSLRNITLKKNDKITSSYKVTWSLYDREVNERWVSGQVPYFDGDTLSANEIFVGWDKPITAVISDVTYTAQYLNGGIQIVGAQVRISDNALRMVGKIYDYKIDGLTELGFEVTVKGETANCAVTKVYTSIVADNQTIYADENNHESNTKFFTFCISGMPANTEFDVCAYAIINGQRITTDSYKYIFTGNDVILPGINIRETNTIEDSAIFNDIFG